MYFDPKRFNDQHTPLKTDDYKLSEEELKHYGIKATKIRSALDERANNKLKEE
jgi:hypothetical protein